jgi:hypothetical protein
MTFDDELEKEIADIVGHLRCPKDFKCYRSGFESLCKARRAEGAVSYLVCLEENSQECIFSRHISMGDFYLCSCPLRRYIADNKKPQEPR